MSKQSRTLEAFKENYNTIGLAAAVAASAALLNPLPLLGALVAEAVYLLFVPDSRWYQARLSARYDDEVIQRREELKKRLFPSLSPTIQMRFERLESVRAQVNSETHSGKKWFREVLRKLDYLLEKFLLFAQKGLEFEQYLLSVREEVGGLVPPPRLRGDDEDDRRPKKRRSQTEEMSLEAGDQWVKDTVAFIQERYDGEIAGIDKLMAADDNMHNQAVLEKRKEVLHRRKQYVGRIGEILTNLRHQLHLIEDTFGLINDEIRARSPEQVLADIEDVVYQTDTLTEALQDVSPFDTLPVAAGAERLYNLPKDEPQ